ncbi:MAG: nucleotidyltransferase family protein [Pseudomonadota bacterium]|nr:nucleotidyltransferase family protein [Pseudomonadota bacterium]
MATLQQYTPSIFQIAERYGAKKIWVFGSFVDGNADDNSDLDLLIDFEQGRDLLDLIGFKQELEERIGRKVDVVTEKGLSPHLRKIILSQARPL